METSIPVLFLNVPTAARTIREVGQRMVFSTYLSHSMNIIIIESLYSSCMLRIGNKVPYMIVMFTGADLSMEHSAPPMLKVPSRHCIMSADRRETLIQ